MDIMLIFESFSHGASNILMILLQFAINFISIFIVVKFLYLKNNHSKRQFVFSFFSISTIIFFICVLLSSVKLELGFTLGLFAIFGIMRYRTDTIPIKEMSYLFVILGQSVVNSLVSIEKNLLTLLVINFVIIISMYWIEHFFIHEIEDNIDIVYENINFIKAEKYADLHADLIERTGLQITRFELISIDFLKDIAKIKIYFKKGK